MKIVFASTSLQYDIIKELINQMYSEIFPYYFSDSEIVKYQQQKVLQLSLEQQSQFSTLKEAFQIIASLQVIISILDNVQNCEKYQVLFQKNVTILQSFDFYFPFQFKDFSEKFNNNMPLSSLSKATNQYLI
ncbi:DUF5365 family protein [Bacillaceae bacterium Marseille-Q3522]|nr:DUF5365 family protein [Bacillaceae bacterium Marseille-Q3522]